MDTTTSLVAIAVYFIFEKIHIGIDVITVFEAILCMVNCTLSIAVLCSNATEYK